MLPLNNRIDMRFYAIAIRCIAVTHRLCVYAI